MYGAGGGGVRPYGQQLQQQPPPQQQGGATGYGYAPQQAAAPGGGYGAPSHHQGYSAAPPQAAVPGYSGYAAGGIGGGGYDPAAYGGAGYGGGMGGQGMGAGHHGGPQPAAWHPTPGGFGPSGRFSAVKLRGLPFGVRDYEVALFLGLDPVDVLVVQRGGRATGEAYAVLAHPAELDTAMRKNKAYMGQRYIEVFEARKMDYYRAIAEMFGGGGGGGRGPPGSPSGRDRSRSPVPRRSTGGSAGGGSSCIVKMRGLPFSATQEEISTFFSDPGLVLAAPPPPEKVTVAAAADGRPNGMAFVEFDSPESAQAALGRDRHLMGSRYIELFISSEEERGRFKPAAGAGGAGPHLI